MEPRLSKEAAEAAAEALLVGEPRFRDTVLGGLVFQLHMRRKSGMPASVYSSIPKMPEPNGFESPGSPYWEIMHR